VAIVPDPVKRWRLYLDNAKARGNPEPILEGCSCPCCGAGFTRGYVYHLLRLGEQLGARLMVLHNLHFVARLMDDLRAAVGEGILAERAAALRAGDVPRGL
jgi:queuine tRNA-ribosyltransferase